jgi:hypothetical protein
MFENGSKQQRKRAFVVLSFFVGDMPTKQSGY